MAGFEYTDPITESGGGFEVNQSHSWTKEFTTSTETEYSITYTNNTGENAAIVFRTPVTIYEYDVRSYRNGVKAENQENNSMMLGVPGEPSHNMISVDDYNQAAAQYDNLDPITDDMLGTPGDPSSYRDYLPASVNPGNSWCYNTPSSYSGLGEISQSITTSMSEENSSTYEFDLEVSAFGSACGVKVGASFQAGAGDGTATMDSTSTSKTGTVTARPNVPNAENYDFRWRFATWTQSLNGNEVPVLGYVVTSVKSPPSIPLNLSLSEHTANSMKLTWEAGKRLATEYRVYRYNPNNPLSVYTYLGSVSGGAAVDGTYSFLLKGLSPDTTYQYVVSAVKVDALEALESSYSDVVIGTTLSDKGLSLELDTIGDQYALLGDTATFTAGIKSYGAYKQVSFQWQEKRSGQNWANLSGATRSSLQVTASADLIGASYRCIVYGTNTAGDSVLYYSNAARLNVGQETILPALAISGYETGSGTQAAPYAGVASHTKLEPKTTSVTAEDVPATVTIHGTDAPVYRVKDSSPALYIAVYTGYDTVNDLPYFEYYTVTKDGETYTLGDLLTVSVSASFAAGETAVALPAGAVSDGTVIPPAVTIGGESCGLYFAVKGTVDETTGQLTAVTDASPQVYASADETAYYAYTQGMTALPGTASDLSGYLIFDSYTYETQDSGANAQWVLGTYNSLSDTYDLYLVNKATTEGTPSDTVSYQVSPVTQTVTRTYKNGTETVAVNPVLEDELTNVTSDVTTYDSVSVTGNQLTLTVTTKKNNAAGTPVAAGNVSYTVRIANQTTGQITTLTGKTDNSGTASETWTATTPGLYSIVVSSGVGTSTPQYYIAGAQSETEYSIQVAQASDAASNSINSATYGDVLKLSVQKINTAAGTVGSCTDTVTYKYSLNGGSEAAISTPSSFTPPAAGSYVLSAYLADGTPLASTTLAIGRKSVTISPYWETGFEDLIPPNSLSEIKPCSDGVLAKDQATLQASFHAVCDLYNESDGILNTTMGGAFTVSLVSTAVNGSGSTAYLTLLQNYNPTLKSLSVLRELDTYPVVYSAGENGTAEGRWGDNGVLFASTQMISIGERLRFQATPAAGFLVDSWTVNGTVLNPQQLESCYTLSGEGTVLTVSALDKSLLDENSQFVVEVSFKSTQHTISYAVEGDGGEIATVTSASEPVANGGKVSDGASVTVSAAPADNMQVKEWLVNGVPYCWPGTEELYRESTLTLQEIGEDKNIVVRFSQKAAYRITVEKEAEEDVDVSGIAISAVNAASQAPLSQAELAQIPEGTAITFIAPVSDTIGVKEWQIDKNGTYVSLPGSGGQERFTVYNITGNWKVKAILTTAQSYNVTYQVVMDGTGAPVTDSAIASLKASSRGSGLSASPTACPAYTPVDFALTLNKNYRVIGWSGAQVSGETDKAASIASLTGHAQVTVTIAEKPVVTLPDTAHGTVSAAALLAGESVPIQDGAKSHVDYASTAAITAVPDTGYYVESIRCGSEALFTCTPETYVPGAKTVTTGSLTADCDITVRFAAKPIVTFAGDANTTVAAVQDGSPLTSGQFVEKYSTGIVFTATPKLGYESDLDSWTVNGAPVSPTVPSPAKNDETAYSWTTPVLADLTVSAGAKALPTYRLTMTVDSIDEAGSGTHGTVGASVTRKQLDGYNSTISASGSFYRDSDIVLTAVPDPGYRVQAWTINGQVIPTSALTQTIRHCQEGLTVSVRFTPSADDVTFGPVNADAQGGYIKSAMAGGVSQMGSASTGVKLGNGSSISFAAVPAAGYEAAAWMINGRDVENTASNAYTYTSDGTASAYISPRFRQVEYAVSYNASPASKGSVSASFEGSTVRGGETVTFTAAPAPGNVVTYWTVNGKAVGAAGNTFTWTVPNGRAETPAVTEYQVLACFQAGVYPVSLIQPENGTLTASRDITSPVAGGTSITFTASPDNHYEVAQWIVNGKPSAETGNQLTLAIQEATQVEVSFQRKQYSITVKPAQGGTVTADPDSTSVPALSSVTFTAVPETGYHLKHWLVNGSTADSSNPLTLSSITGSTTVQAVFEIDTFQVNFSYDTAGTSGAISATCGGKAIQSGSRVPYDATVKLSAVPSGTDVIECWTVDGKLVSVMDDVKDAASAITVSNIQKDTDIVVRFLPRPTYTVEVQCSPTDGGTASISGTEGSSITVARGGSVTLTAEAASYREFRDWTVTAGGSSRTETGATLTLREIRANTTVKANFLDAVSYGVLLSVEDAAGATHTGSTVSVTAGGTGIKPGSTDASAVSVLGGSKVVFTAAPVDGAMIKSWSVNGVVQDTLSNTLTIDGITEKTAVTAVFEDYQEFTIPAGTADYTIRIQTEEPDNGVDGTVRKGADLSFQVVPAEGKAITALTPSAGAAVSNADGSWTVSIQDVQANVTLDATVISGIPLTIAEAQNGAVTVTQNGTVLSSGAVLMPGDAIVIKAKANSGYRLSSLTVNGEEIPSGSTFTVPADNISSVAVAAVFSESTLPPVGPSGPSDPVEKEIIHIVTSTDKAELTSGQSCTVQSDAGKLTVSGTKRVNSKGETQAAIQVTLNGKPVDGLTGFYVWFDYAKGGDNTTAYLVNSDGTYTVIPKSIARDGRMYVTLEGSATFVVRENPVSFQDTAPAWAKSGVSFVTSHTLFNGVDGGLFWSDGSMTRAMLVTVLHRLQGLPREGQNTFSDVAAGSWYEQAVAWASCHGIVKGTDTGFAPDANITREQLAVILCRYAEQLGIRTEAAQIPHEPLPGCGPHQRLGRRGNAVGR